MFDISANTRPKYTKYEISKMVKEKLNNSSLTKEEFINQNGIEQKIFDQILQAQVSFSKEILEVCSKILDKSIFELISNDEDKGFAFRSEEISENTIKTVDIANLLFNEIIMQDKIYG